MQLPRLVPSLEQQGPAMPVQQGRQERLGSPMGPQALEREPSPPKLEAMKPAAELYDQYMNQPRIFIEPSHVVDGRMDNSQRNLDYVPSRLEQALTMVKMENRNGSGISAVPTAGTDSGVFRNPPPVHPSPTKKKPRPTPLHIPSCVSTGTPGGITPGTYQSQMRSPREMGGFYHRSGTTPPPYTPPPMLSPIRSGSGLYFNVGASLSSGGVTPKSHLPMTSPSLISMHRRSTGGK